LSFEVIDAEDGQIIQVDFAIAVEIALVSGWRNNGAPIRFRDQVEQQLKVLDFVGDNLAEVLGIAYARLVKRAPVNGHPILPEIAGRKELDILGIDGAVAVQVTPVDMRAHR
jgi:hypothetical protein